MLQQQNKQTSDTVTGKAHKEGILPGGKPWQWEKALKATYSDAIDNWQPVVYIALALATYVQTVHIYTYI